MKLLLFLAFVVAFVAAGFLIATAFTTGNALVYVSISAGLALVAFIILCVAYVNKSVK